MAIRPQRVAASPMDVFNANATLPRGFFAQVSMVLIQPREFFRTLAPVGANRQWLWAAVLILVLLAMSAIQQSAQTAPDTGIVAGPEFGGEGQPFGGPFPPPDAGPVPGGTPAADPAANWMTALTIVGAQIIQWGVLAALLSEVTMFNGHAPRLSKNLAIVIWTSMPMALLALVQILFMAGGGTINNPGFTGFLDQWEAYGSFNIYLRSAIHALASHVTLFWLWNLLLLYIGARQGLQGKRSATFLVVLVWVVILSVAFAFQSYQTLNAEDTSALIDMPGEIPFGEMPDMEAFNDPSASEEAPFEVPPSAGGPAAIQRELPEVSEQ